jgi:hypothetical protein
MVQWHAALAALDARVRLAFTHAERVGDDLRLRALVQERT